MGVFLLYSPSQISFFKTMAHTPEMVAAIPSVIINDLPPASPDDSGDRATVPRLPDPVPSDPVEKDMRFIRELAGVCGPTVASAYIHQQLPGQALEEALRAKGMIHLSGFSNLGPTVQLAWLVENGVLVEAQVRIDFGMPPLKPAASPDVVQVTTRVDVKKAGLILAGAEGLNFSDDED